jgi:chromosome segregation ATPase
MSKTCIEKETECNNLMEQLQNQKTMTDSLNQSLSNKVEDLVKELEQHKTKFSELNEILKTKEESENILNEALISLKQEISDKDQRITELDEIKKSLELELTTSKEHQISFQEEVIKKEETIQSFASNENDLLAAPKSLPDDLLQENENSLQDLRGKVDSYSREKVELEKEINRLREFESNAKGYQERCEKYSKEIEEIQVRNGKINLRGYNYQHA